MYECTCPYCDKDLNDPDDAYNPGELYEKQCRYCEKIFIFEIDYIKTYHCKQADCLNGAEHDFKKTKTFPERFAKLRCTMCGMEKSLSVSDKEIK